MKDIVKSPINDEYNSNVEEAVENFRDKLETEPIKSASEFRKRLEDASAELREVNEAYTKVSNRQNRGKNVETFVANVKETFNTLNDMKRGNGLTGNLHFNNFSRDQIAEIREILVNINLLTGDLIRVYEDEL